MARKAAILPDNILKRGLNRAEAAEYVGLSPNTFDAAVGEGIFPQSIHIGRRLIWDRRALDLALDVLSGLSDHLAREFDLDEELGVGADSAP